MADCLLTLVVDTSILIDVYIGKVVTPLFTLPYTFVAPDVIIAELQEPNGETFLKLGLQQKELSGEQVTKVLRFRRQYSKPSVNDLFALVLAQILEATLLTNDRNLRKVATKEGTPVHGTLWVLDEMIEQRVILPGEAATALKRMCNQGSRLPQDECNKRFEQWRL